MAKGYFKRIDPTPYRVRLDLTGPITIVNKDEIIYADTSTFKDVIGFVFVGWNKPPENNKISTDPLKPTKIANYANMVTVQGAKQVAPHKIYLANKIKEEPKPIEVNPTEVKYHEDVSEPIIKEEAKVEVEVEVEVETDPVKEKENSKKALIQYLKKFEGRKWFVMKKEDAKGYIERLELDISTLPNSKNEYISFLKEYIKSCS